MKQPFSFLVSNRVLVHRNHAGGRKSGVCVFGHEMSPDTRMFGRSVLTSTPDVSSECVVALRWNFEPPKRLQCAMCVFVLS